MEKTGKLEHARQRWRTLQAARHSLYRQLTASTSELSREMHLRQVGQPFGSGKCAQRGDASSHRESIRSFARAGLDRHCRHLLSETGAIDEPRGPKSSKNQHVNCEGPSSASLSGLGPHLSLYARLEPISFVAVNKYMCPASSENSCNNMPQAIAEYQQSVCKAAGVPLAAVCWFLQWPWDEVSPPLSFTTGAASPECSLAACVCMPLSTIESFFLVMEHEALCMAETCNYNAPAHPCLAQGPLPPPLNSPYTCSMGEAESAVHPSQFGIPPTRPDPDVLARTFVRCGVKQRMLLKDAMDCMLGAMLRKYHALLPRMRWRAVCMQGMHVAQAVVKALRAVPQEPPQTGADVFWGSTEQRSVGGEHTTSGKANSARVGVDHSEVLHHWPEGIRLASL